MSGIEGLRTRLEHGVRGASNDSEKESRRKKVSGALQFISRDEKIRKGRDRDPIPPPL